MAFTPGSSAGGVPTGTILPYAGTIAPAGYLMCDGASYLRSEYSNLAEVLGCSGSNCAFGSADASHFYVPDMRGRFMRGVDGTAGNDPGSNLRTSIAANGNSGNTVGSLQSDAFQGHHHPVGDNNATQIKRGSSAGTFGLPDNTHSNSTGWNLTAFGAITDGTNGNPRTSQETRPKNVYVNYIIKI